MNIAVILAGGSGTRMKSGMPKQHIKVMSHEVIEYTLSAFCNNAIIDKVIVVSNAEYIDEVLKFKALFKKLEWIITGGSTRMLSVFNAVQFLNEYCNEEDNIVISDAVRPCITFKEVQNIIACLNEYEAVTTGVEIYETILRTKENKLIEIVPREGVIRQTSPEGYKYKVLKKLYLDQDFEEVKKYKNIGIDQLIAEHNDVGIVKSTPLNFKITTQDDLYFFETVLKKSFDSILFS